MLIPVSAISVPLIESVTPEPVPLRPAIAVVQVTGSGFEPNLKAVIVLNGETYAVLSGSSRLENLTPNSFTFSNAVFASENRYGLFVLDSNGARSEITLIAVIPLPPVIFSVIQVNGGLQVSGNYFQPSMTVTIAAQSGEIIADTEVGGVSATLCEVPLSAPLPAGPYSMNLTIADCSQSSPFLFEISA